MYLAFVAKPNSGVATLPAARALLSTADTAHGREIFFGRGTCSACHKLDDIGSPLSPDLNGISSRRDMTYVLTSNLNPDDYIVEGFQQTRLRMSSGRTLFGMVQEETQRYLNIYLQTGKLVVVKVAEIELRKDGQTSGMPSNFKHTLSSQDVADVAKWLMNRPKEK